MSAGRGSEEDQEHGAESRGTGRGNMDLEHRWGDSSTKGQRVEDTAEGGESCKDRGKEKPHRDRKGGGGPVLVAESGAEPNSNSHPTRAAPPLSCQHIRFPQMPLPDTSPSSPPSPYPWTQAIHPNTGWKKKTKQNP